MVRRATADIEAGGTGVWRSVFDGGFFLLARVRTPARGGAARDAVRAAHGVRDGMMVWICYLVSRLKAAWKALVEAAEKQRNYWDGDDP